MELDVAKVRGLSIYARQREDFLVRIGPDHFSFGSDNTCHKQCDVAATATCIQTFHSLVESNPFQKRRSSRQHPASQEIQTFLAFSASADRVATRSFRSVDFPASL